MQDSHYQLFRATAETPEALLELLRQIEQSKTPSVDLSQAKHSVSIAYRTAESFRMQLQARIAEFADSTAVPSMRKSQDLCLLFTGQGAQYAGMAKHLYAALPCFKSSIDQYTLFVKAISGIDCLSCLIGENEQINQTLYTQPCLVILQLALYDLFKKIGIRGNMLIGHSVGEFSASACSDAYTINSVLSMISKRATLMQSVRVDGGMIAVATEHQQIETLMESESISLNYAAFNAPKQIVLAGDNENIDKMHQCCKTQKIKSRILSVSHPFHSALMQPITDAFSQYCASIPHNERFAIPLLSNLSGQILDKPQSPLYWSQHILQPVMFSQSVEAAWQHGSRVFLELGPDAVLAKLAKKCLKDKHATLLYAQRKGLNGVDQLIHTVEQLDACGLQPCWNTFLGMLNASHSSTVSET